MTTELAQREIGKVEVYQTWTPEALKEEIDRERQLRVVVIEYYREAMVEGHHYYRLDEDGKKKPALSKEGALNLCSLFKVRPEPDLPTETFTPDGHYMVRYRVNLVSVRTGEMVAFGDGLCSTRESKYAYRWFFERDIPVGIDKSTLVRVDKTSRKGQKYSQYKLPNPDLADQYNTVLKMSEKRAIVDGVLKLPLASELFTQDLEEQIQDGVRQKRQTQENSPLPGEPLTSQPIGISTNAITADEVNSLVELSRKCGVDTSEFRQDIRRLMSLLPVTKVTREFLQEHMTKAQYQQQYDDYTSRLKREVEQSMDDDVPLTTGPNSLESTETHESPVGDAIPEGEQVDASTAIVDGLQDNIGNSEGVEPLPSGEGDIPQVEVDEDGFVTQPHVTNLVNRADAHGQKGLLRQIKGNDPGWVVEKFRYAWVQVAAKKAAKVSP